MPSPFPGMDPWLEDPEIFPDLHDSLITYMREALQSSLPPPYYATTGRRVWIEVSHRPIGPDLNVMRPRGESHRTPANGGLAVATGRSRVKIVHVPHDERREPYLEVYAGQGNEKRLVTTIEVLSWSNKTPGDHGQDLYLRKQREILDRKVHLVEIDLLRGGVHTTAVPKDRALTTAGPFDYHVCVHRFDNFEDYEVYPIELEEPLPEFDIPLLPGSPSLTIDLQRVFDRCYDTASYSREIQYLVATPVPALIPERLAWARERIQRVAGAG